MDYQYKNQYQYPSDFSLNDQFAYQNNDNYSNSKEEEIRNEVDTMVRLGFVRKVYGILSVQLFVTTMFSLIAMVSDSVKKFMINNMAIMLIMLLLVIFHSYFFLYFYVH
jgi:FtsH-binding integral membrane protein